VQLHHRLRRGCDVEIWEELLNFQDTRVKQDLSRHRGSSKPARKVEDVVCRPDPLQLAEDAVLQRNDPLFGFTQDFDTKRIRLGLAAGLLLLNGGG